MPTRPTKALSLVPLETTEGLHKPSRATTQAHVHMPLTIVYFFFAYSLPCCWPKRARKDKKNLSGVRRPWAIASSRQTGIVVRVHGSPPVVTGVKACSCIQTNKQIVPQWPNQLATKKTKSLPLYVSCPCQNPYPLSDIVVRKTDFNGTIGQWVVYDRNLPCCTHQTQGTVGR